jgi:hypothetical protein
MTSFSKSYNLDIENIYQLNEKTPGSFKLSIFFLIFYPIPFSPITFIFIFLLQIFSISLQFFNLLIISSVLFGGILSQIIFIFGLIKRIEIIRKLFLLHLYSLVALIFLISSSYHVLLIHPITIFISFIITIQIYTFQFNKHVKYIFLHKNDKYPLSIKSQSKIITLTNDK